MNRVGEELKDALLVAIAGTTIGELITGFFFTRSIGSAGK